MEISHTHLKDKKNETDEDEYETVTEIEVINSLTPIWRREKKNVSDEDYDTFYKDKFNDYESPLRHMHIKAEGTFEYTALLYIPSHAPFNYYSKEYEKGLQLYSNGVLIMEKCSDLLPDYFSFVKGVVDSPDLTLNISRETLQQNRILKTIANSIENKIKKELETMLEEKKEDYEKFFKNFGLQLKYGVYNDFGMHKEKLQDLLIYSSSFEEKTTTLKDYVSRMKEDQKNIYYACGETIDKIKMLPQVEAAKEKGYEVLYCTDQVDEFVFMTLRNYAEKNFVNVCGENTDFDTEEEKEELKKANEDAKEMFDIMKESIPEVAEIRFTNKLKDHPVCLSSKGEISVEMEKTLSNMPLNNGIKASKVLEINQNHEIAKTLKKLGKKNKEELQDYAKVLYAEARMIEGLPVENPTEIASLVCKFMAK